MTTLQFDQIKREAYIAGRIAYLDGREGIPMECPKFSELIRNFVLGTADRSIILYNWKQGFADERYEDLCGDIPVERG